MTASGYEFDNCNRKSYCVFGSDGVVLAIRSSDLRWMSWRRLLRNVRFCVLTGIGGSGESSVDAL